jgi:hypothetical protein
MHIVAYISFIFLSYSRLGFSAFVIEDQREERRKEASSGNIIYFVEFGREMRKNYRKAPVLWVDSSKGRRCQLSRFCVSFRFRDVIYY